MVHQLGDGQVNGQTRQDVIVRLLNNANVKRFEYVARGAALGCGDTSIPFSDSVTDGTDITDVTKVQIDIRPQKWIECD